MTMNRFLFLAFLGLTFTSCSKKESAVPATVKPAVPETAKTESAPKVEEAPLAEPTDAKLSREPYLQLATTESIYVVWRTNGVITPVVRWGTAPDALDNRVADEDIVTRTVGGADHPLHSAPEGTHQFEAKITGLAVDTQYYYAVYDASRLLSDSADGKEYTFRTHPEAGKEHPVRFWVVGDSGTGGEPPKKVHQAMRDYVKMDDRYLDLYLHVGDMAYTRGRDDEFQRGFFNIYDETLRNVPVWAAMGNHEGLTSNGGTGVGPYYDAYICPKDAESGGVKSGMESYYSFNYGRVHFICLNSHDLDRSPTAVMAKWLQEDLEKVKEADWLVAYFHHPPYTMGSHDSNTESQLIEMRKFIMPILESGGVDIVFTGHSHIYERSMLMDGAYATPTVADGVILDDGDGDPNGDGAYKKSAGIHANEGAIQIVAGHGGQGLSRKGTMPVMRKIIVENGSVIVDVDGNTMHTVMVNAAGEVSDMFEITKEGSVTPQRIENPWQPEPYVTKKAAGKKATKPKQAATKGPSEFTSLIAKNAEWEYRTSDNADWLNGRAGFGYGDDDDETVLSDMAGNYTVVHVKKEFELTDAAQLSKVGLMMRFDDAFVVSINGKEVLRVGVDKKGAVTANEAKTGYLYFPLKDAAAALTVGKNEITIEGHNQKKDSSDFTLDPFLILEK
jgi:hypothetical protein